MLPRHLEGTESSGTHATGEEEEDGAFPEYIAFGVVPLAMALGIVTRTTLAKWVPIPYTVLLLLWGGVFGAIYTEVNTPFNPSLNNAIRAWISMDPRVLQVIFFPILIFASAFNAQFHILERRLGQIIFLALPGVILGAGLTATFVKVILPYDWSWDLCLVFGSMVAATDPVAVVALLEELGVSEKLGTLIEGESLLNDGSAIVVFEVFLEAVEGIDRNWHQILSFGARLALGGPAIGAIIGLIGAFVLGYVINDALVEVSLTLLLAFATFALCEDTDVKVSGVLGIVACGVVLSYYGKPRVSSSVLPSLMDFWKTLQFFADTTIFFLSGLIVVGVAVSEGRAITAEDFGYLLALFVALYIIRGIVVITAYPILRSGEYKITVPQMIVLTHSGLRGAVALILALVVDGVHEIDQEVRDKIVFLTAGIAVLSLLVNGTTTGPLVRFLKLDRASEASEGVFKNACFALELNMEKQEAVLKEDPFLGDANWNLVWRYIPIFTSESYWHRLCKGRISLSSNEVETITDANCRANCRKNGERSFLDACKDWVRNKKGGFAYTGIPHRLRFPWYDYHTKFLFEESGGEAVWGDLVSFLANRTAGDESAEAWTGHLKHSRYDGTSIVSSGGGGDASKGATLHSQEEAKITEVGSEVGHLPALAQNDGPGPAVTAPAKGDETANPLQVLGDGNDDDDDDDDDKEGGEEEGKDGERPKRKLRRKRSFEKRMFRRAASMVRAAGMDISLTEKKEAPGVADKSALVEARLRFLCALKAEYFKAKKEGKLGSSGLRVLTEGINNAHDRVDKGFALDGWKDLSGHFTQGWQTVAAKYMNWWPARPVAAAAIARRVSFQMELAWNFLEAHHEGNLKSFLADNGQINKVQRTINIENQTQINLVEDTISKLTVSAPMVTRSVKTRTAARIMIQRFREATELLAENGHLDEKEEEVLMNAVTEGEMQIAYHPNLEHLPPLPIVLEKVEFLSELSHDERQRLIDAGACYYHEYVGEIPLMEMGKLGARGTKKSVERDFFGWFYVVRGQVEKERYDEDGALECCAHSSGLLFGITDSMLGIPHHAGYTTHGFSNLVVFDKVRILEEAAAMPALDLSLWKSVAAHCLRRSIRFHKYKLLSCHTLMDSATFLSGGTGPNGEETLEMAADDAIVLVRGNIISGEGKIAKNALGQADTSGAPVLLEPLGQGEGASFKVSGDFKAFRMPCDLLANFAREERSRMHRQATMKRASMTLSTLSDLNADDAGNISEGTHESRDEVYRNLMEREMAAKFDLHPRTASVGIKAAMKLMAGLKRKPGADDDGGSLPAGAANSPGVAGGGVDEGVK